MTTQLPKWTNSMLNKYSSGVAHAFILHFNTADFVVPGVSLKSYLTRLLGNRKIIAYYNRSEGITFAQPSMENDFKELLGLNNQQEDEILAALGQNQSGGDIDLPRNPAQALPLLERLLKTGNTDEKTSAVIIDYAETLAPATDISIMSVEDRTNLITLQKWGRDMAMANAGNPIYLITSNLTDIHPSIRAASSKYEAIEIPLPDKAGRLNFISLYLDDKPTFDMDGVTPNSMANATAGLSYIHIEDIFLRAEQEGVMSWQLIKERKDTIVASEFGEVIEIIEPRFGWEAIGGLLHVKNFFQKSVINPIKSGRFNRVPMGILMTGPAGTGKSAVAEAVAREAGVNSVSLNLARIFGQYVGQSERNLEKALKVIESMQPTIVFIDEIDQSVSRGQGSGDSGVSSRIFKRLLEFMSDTGHRGKVVFLAATNRPDLMDAALRRPGRFDKKIPFLIPDESERKSIFEVMAIRYGLKCDNIPANAITITDGWTGAELETAVVKAIELIEDEELNECQAIEQSVQRLSPSTSDIEFMTMIAIRETNDLDLLPERYKSLLQDRDKLEEKIKEQNSQNQTRGKREL